MTDMNTPRWSATEQIAEEQRILYFAALIHDGARIGQTGTLLITQVQLERAQELGEPLPIAPITATERAASHAQRLGVAALVSEINRPRQQWLDQNLANILPDSADGYSRITNQLRKSGVSTVRDVLVMGKMRIANVKNIGVTSVQRFEAVLNDNALGIVWQNSPTDEMVAELCDNLADVTSRYLDDSYTFYCTVSKFGPNVQRLIDTPAETLAKQYSDRRDKYYPPRNDAEERIFMNKAVSEAHAAKQLAANFAVKFYAAKRRLSQPTS